MELTSKPVRSDADYLHINGHGIKSESNIGGYKSKGGEGFHAQKQDISWQHVK